MSHQTIVIREQDTTLRIEQVVVPSRITSNITLPVGGGPFTFRDENQNLLLTLDKDGNIISEKGFFELAGQAPPAISPVGKMRFYFDSATNRLLLSENGGAYADLMDGAGDVVGPGSATDDALVRWDTATGKLVQDSNALLNDAGDLTLVGSQSLGKFLDTTGIAAPAVSPAGESRLYFDSTSNKLRLSENGGAFTDIVGAGGDVVGPASATDEALVRFDGATGKLVQNSLVKISDTGLMTLGGSLDLNGNSIIDGSGNMTIGDGSAGQTLTWDGATNNIVFGPGGSIKSDGFLEISVVNGGLLLLAQATLTFGALNSAQFDVVPTTTAATFLSRNARPFTLRGSVADSASAVAFNFDTTVLDSTSFTAGALHSRWADLNNVEIMSLTPGGDLTVLGDLKVTGQYIAPIRFAFESPNDWRFTSGGVIQFSIGPAGQFNSAINRGHIYAAKVSDSASAIAHDFDQAFSLTTAGAKLVSVKNATVEKFFIDKDGNTTLNDANIGGDINHDGSNVGFYGTAPAAQSAAYARNAAVVEDRTLLASASATIINNNNVLAALIADLQSRGFIG